MLSPDQMRTRGSLKWTLPAPVLGMATAEADVELAEPIRHALLQAIGNSRTGPLHDTHPLISAFEQFGAERWGWSLDMNRFLVGPSVNTVVVTLLQQLIDPGDIVAYSSPVYPVFRHLPGRINATALDVPLSREGGQWALDLPALGEAFSRPSVRAYLLCHPQNPTGTVHSVADLLALAEIAVENQVVVISDEILAPLTLDGEFRPFLECGKAARAVGVAVTAASKAWNLSGVNCAFAVWDNPQHDRIAKSVASELRWETSTLGAVAAQSAFADGTSWLDAFRSILGGHVRMIQDASGETGGRMKFDGVDAGYLAWLDLSEVGEDPAVDLFRAAEVETAPGARFGPAGVGHCRLNFACSTETLQTALSRILQWCRKVR